MPLLSIIMPVYKVEKYLRDSIDSILCQTFQDWELILVDDGSPDNCGTICDEYGKCNTKIHVVHRPNGGLSAARNTGMDHAKGNYITFCDSDDTIAPETYKENIDILLNNSNIDIIQFPTYWMYGTPQQWKDTTTPRLLSHEKIFSNFYDNKPIDGSVCHKIYKRSLIITHRFQVGRIYEDKFMMLELLPNIHDYYISDKGCYYYYLRDNSILTTFNFKRAIDWVDSEIEIIKLMKQYPDLKIEYVKRYIKTVKAMENAKFMSPKSSIVPQEEELACLTPNRKDTHNCHISLNNRFWLLVIKILEMEKFTQCYQYTMRLTNLKKRCK